MKLNFFKTFIISSCFFSLPTLSVNAMRKNKITYQQNVNNKYNKLENKQTKNLEKTEEKFKKDTHNIFMKSIFSRYFNNNHETINEKKDEKANSNKTNRTKKYDENINTNQNNTYKKTQTRNKLNIYSENKSTLNLSASKTKNEIKSKQNNNVQTKNLKPSKSILTKYDKNLKLKTYLDENEAELNDMINEFLDDRLKDEIMLPYRNEIFKHIKSKIKTYKIK